LPAIAQTLEHFIKLPRHTYTRPRVADVTSLLYSICNFDFVVTIVIVQMCLAFKKSLQERSLDIERALKSVTLVQSSQTAEQMLNNSTTSILRGVLKYVNH
jgi:hypothetical protein